MNVNGMVATRSERETLCLLLCKSLYIKRGKVSVRNVRTYVRNGGRGQLSSD